MNYSLKQCILGCTNKVKLNIERTITNNDALRSPGSFVSINCVIPTPIHPSNKKTEIKTV